MFHPLLKIAACRLLLGGDFLATIQLDPEFENVFQNVQLHVVHKYSHFCQKAETEPQGGPKPTQVEHRVRTRDSGRLTIHSRTTGGIDLKAYATETATRSKGRRIEMFFWKKRTRRGNCR